MNERIAPPLLLLLFLTAGTLAYFIYYGQWFPPTMAVHFTMAGEPDGWIDRVKFIVIGSSISFMVPTFVVACVGVLPRVLPGTMLNVPNKAYWGQAERREVALGRLLTLSMWLGCIVQVFLLGIWVVIGRANAAGSPAHLSGSHTVLVIGFLVALVGFGAWFQRSFAVAR